MELAIEESQAAALCVSARHSTSAHAHHSSLAAPCVVTDSPVVGGGSPGSAEVREVLESGVYRHDSLGEVRMAGTREGEGRQGRGEGEGAVASDRATVGTLARKPSSQGAIRRMCHGSRISWLVLLLLLLGAEAGDISCQGIRYIYFNKGLDTSAVPRSPQQGKFDTFIHSCFFWWTVWS